MAPFIGNEHRWRILVAGLALLMLAALGFGYVDRRVSEQARFQARQDGRDDAAILAAGLQAELDKFSIAPVILADDTEVHALGSGRSASAKGLNVRFETLARQSNAAAIYLMNADGLTLAASNWRLPTSFVGSNYRFRQYFTEAYRNGSGTEFALGTVSRKPGLYIAQAVRENGRIKGIVTVKVEFDKLERSWREATPGVFITDRSGVILITSNEAWRFHTTRPELAGGRDHALDRRRFGTDALEPFAVAADSIGRGKPGWMDSSQPLSLPGWRLHLMVDPTERVSAAKAQMRFYLLLVAGALAASTIVAAALRIRREKRAEQAISDRTHALREQLGQANRLALLGQVTAGVGHEINQPVAAARVYAENGAEMLDRGQIVEAQANFARIVGIAERIGTITAELRRFGRRGSAEAELLPIGQAIDGATLLLHDRIVRSGTDLVLPGEDERATQVRSEPVRLEQVLVNLIQNALDAMGQGGRIALTLTTDARHCELAVQDEGPGLGEIGERIFQPFATTKRDGLGLGLVISRDIMRELGGDLTSEACAHGARFVMRIPRG